MSKQERTAIAFDLDRLKKVTRFATQKLKLQELPDEMAKALHDSIVRQRAKRKQNALELEIVSQTKGGGDPSIGVGKAYTESLTV